MILKAMKWDPDSLIGNKTVQAFLKTEVDIRSEKLKLHKFLSEYDTNYISEDLKFNPYLTFKDFAMNHGH